MQWSDHPMGNCRRCYYFTRNPRETTDEGVCHRYPQPVEHDVDYYCGEFVPDPSCDPYNQLPNNYV